MKAWKACGYALLALGLVLQGCGGDSARTKTMTTNKNKEKVVLTFYGNKVEARDVAVIENILNDYMKANPHVSITYESLKGAEYYKILDKRLDSKNGDDIFIVDHDHLLRYQKKGYVAKLNDLPAMKEYLPQVMDQMRWEDGSIYYASTSISAFALFCNMDLLKEKKIEVPQSFGDFKKACAAFSANGKKPLIVNQALSLGTVIIAGSWHDYYTQNKTEELCKAVNEKQQPMSKLLDAGITKAMELTPYIDTQKCLTFKKNKDDFKEFAKGEAPFMLTGAWNNPRLAKLNPKFEYALYPYPIKDDGNILMTNVDTRMVVNANSKHVEESKRFLNYLLQSDKLDKFAKSQSSFGVLKGTKNKQEHSDKRMAAINEAYAKENTMIGSDDRIKYPMWTKGWAASKAILAGSDRKKVEKIFDADSKQAK